MDSAFSAFSQVSTHEQQFSASADEPPKSLLLLQRGTPGSPSWKATFFCNRQPISPLHDLQLYRTESGPCPSSSNNAPRLVHCVCTTPAATWVRHGVSVDEEGTPLKVSVSFLAPRMTDLADGSLPTALSAARPRGTQRTGVPGEPTRQRRCSSDSYLVTGVKPTDRKMAVGTASASRMLGVKMMGDGTADKVPAVGNPSSKMTDGRSINSSNDAANVDKEDVGMRRRSASIDLGSTAVPVPDHFADDAPWSIGYLPQTWANSNKAPSKFSTRAWGDDSGTALVGLEGWRFDGRPMEVVDISAEKVRTVGEVYLVKPLGAFLVGKDDGSGELSWKVIAVAEDDPMAKKLSGLACLQKHLPGILELIRGWLRTCHVIRAGDRMQTILLDHQPVDVVQALLAISELHRSWRFRYGLPKYPSPESADASSVTSSGNRLYPLIITHVPDSSSSSQESFNFQWYSEDMTPDLSSLSSSPHSSCDVSTVCSPNIPRSMGIPSSNPRRSSSLFFTLGEEDGSFHVGSPPLKPIKSPKDTLPPQSKVKLGYSLSRFGRGGIFHMRSNQRRNSAEEPRGALRCESELGRNRSSAEYTRPGQGADASSIDLPIPPKHHGLTRLFHHGL
eukprot:TRINITY_DN30099_c0_g1_i1.p1 TRINITY_DN30099_c0_g1~~TRINITY_DN30099_c0_g1_i1.p1  ORF type:complete len:678 (+),score=55.26 TRINITY_DN30099_c0_g1_i1:182-2035(+)